MKRALLFFTFTFLIITSFAQWTDDPVINNVVFASDGDEALPKIAADEEGNTFIAFHSNSSGNYDVLVSYMDEEGISLWEEPLTVSNHPQQSWISDFDMVMDQEGNAIITFSDIRNGNPDIHAYKISPQGEFLWGDDGITCSDTPEAEYGPRLTVTEDNNAFITFIHMRETGTDQMVLTAIDPEGNKLLGADGMIFTPENDADYTDPYVTASGNDVIVVYSLNTGNFPYADRLMYAISVNSSGDELWPEPAIITEAGGIAGYTELTTAPDEQGGVYIGWHDDRDSDMISSSFIQHITAGGTAMLGEAGVEVATQAGFHRFNPKIVLSDAETHEVMVFWRQTNANQSEAGLYGQRLDSDGERLWGDNGQELLPVGTTFGILHDAREMTYERNSSGQVILFYTKKAGTSGDYLNAMAIDHNAAPVWPETTAVISTNNSGVSDMVATEMRQSQFVVAWKDGRNNNGIYAQNIHNDGSIGIIDTEIPDLVEDKVTIYPNPATTLATIKNGNFTEVIIRNVIGQVISHRHLSPHATVQFRPSASGIYFATFVDGKRKVTRKMVIGKQLR